MKQTSAAASHQSQLLRPILPKHIIAVPDYSRALAASSTRWYRKKRKQETGREVQMRKVRTTCGQCGQDRLPGTHKQFYGQWWCQRKAVQTAEEWLQDQRATRRVKKKTQLPQSLLPRDSLAPLPTTFHSVPADSVPSSQTAVPPLQSTLIPPSTDQNSTPLNATPCPVYTSYPLPFSTPVVLPITSTTPVIIQSSTVFIQSPPIILLPFNPPPDAPNPKP